MMNIFRKHSVNYFKNFSISGVKTVKCLVILRLHQLLVILHHAKMVVNAMSYMMDILVISVLVPTAGGN